MCGLGRLTGNVSVWSRVVDWECVCGLGWLTGNVSMWSRVVDWECECVVWGG